MVKEFSFPYTWARLCCLDGSPPAILLAKEGKGRGKKRGNRERIVVLSKIQPYYHPALLISL